MVRHFTIRQRKAELNIQQKVLLIKDLKHYITDQANPDWLQKLTERALQSYLKSHDWLIKKEASILLKKVPSIRFNSWGFNPLTSKYKNSVTK